MRCLLISSAILLLLFSSFLISCLDAKRIPGFRSIVPHENSLSPVASYEEKTRIKYRDWIKVKITGPKVIKVKSGSRIELECEGSGSPTPNVQWFHGQTPVSQVS
uniref:Ig-like domain-containing protein n=1 Tax=Clastoptera arizonana TaxID=38151 RepID=A0A1B6D054_9HEMI